MARGSRPAPARSLRPQLVTGGADCSSQVVHVLMMPMAATSRPRKSSRGDRRCGGMDRANGGGAGGGRPRITASWPHVPPSGRVVERREVRQTPRYHRSRQRTECRTRLTPARLRNRTDERGVAVCISVALQSRERRMSGHVSIAKSRQAFARSRPSGTPRPTAYNAVSTASRASVRRDIAYRRCRSASPRTPGASLFRILSKTCRRAVRSSRTPPNTSTCIFASCCR